MMRKIIDQTVTPFVTPGVVKKEYFLYIHSDGEIMSLKSWLSGSFDRELWRKKWL